MAERRRVNLDVDNTWLEPLVLGEERELYAVVRRNAAYLRRFLSWPNDTETVEEYRDLIKDGQGKEYSFAIRREKAGIIGHIALMQEEWQMPEIGYWIAEEYSRKGIATNALQTLTRLAHQELGLPTIMLKIRQDNAASSKVAYKAGYRFVEPATDHTGIHYCIWHSIANNVIE